jgi:hypothetical protein
MPMRVLAVGFAMLLLSFGTATHAKTVRQTVGSAHSADVCLMSVGWCDNFVTKGVALGSPCKCLPTQDYTGHLVAKGTISSRVPHI